MPASESSSSRLASVDALRGLIMMVMALDHTRAFVVREHPFEIWSEPLPHYDAVLPFVTRLVTHFCAPGFFFLMGVGMALMATARSRSGWTSGRVTRYFITRGILLLVVQQLIENPAWILGSLGAAPDPAAGFKPPGASSVVFVFGVLFGLGMSMVVWGVLLRLPSAAVAFLSALAIVATQSVMLFEMPVTPEHVTEFAPWARLLMVPGRTGIWLVIYPIIPWLGLTGLGIVFGRCLRTDRSVAKQSFAWAAAFLLLFIVVRTSDGFGNIHTPVPAGWIGFLNVTKYPPSIAFIAMTLGVDLMLLGILAAVFTGTEAVAPVLLTFGRSALFFYIAHLYLYAVIGFAFPHGAPIAMAYPPWLAGLCILYPLCRRYERFKHSRAPESIWRFF